MAARKTSGVKRNAIREIGYFRFALTIAAGLVLAGLGFALSVSGANRSRNPAAAVLLNPYDAPAQAELADRLFLANPQKPTQQIRQMALDSVRQQAINPKAVRLLGFFEDAQGRRDKARAYVALSEKLSRREQGAQLWLLEAEAQDNNVAATLKHYDILLRTKPDTQPLLYNRLIAAIESDAVRQGLMPYFKAGKPWAVGFLGEAISRSPDMASVTAFVTEAGGFGKTPAAPSLAKAMLSRLVEKAMYADARRIFSMLPNRADGSLVNPAFRPSDIDNRFGPVGWQIIESPDAGGGMVESSGAKAPALYVYASSATTRLVARRLLFLSPGSYGLQTRIRNGENAGNGKLRWQLRCADNADGGVIWTQAMEGPALDATLSITAGCSVQYLELVISGGDDQAGVETTFGELRLQPVP